MLSDIEAAHRRERITHALAAGTALPIAVGVMWLNLRAERSMGAGRKTATKRVAAVS